jgi:hypothetical protein
VSDGAAPVGPASGLPADLLPWAWLIGRWVGVGTGQYPTIDDFRFGQEVVFTTDGRPFLSYASRSWLLDDDGQQVRPTAAESGFWRPRPDNRVEVVLAHPTGFVEVWAGEQVVADIVDGQVTRSQVRLVADVVARTESAKQLDGGERLYGLVDGALLWTYDMAAVGQPLHNHLAARLVRAD